METVLDSLKALRRCDTPLAAITTSDQIALIRAAGETINGGAPQVAWDCCQGLVPVNDEGAAAINDNIPTKVDGMDITVQDQTRLPSDCLNAIKEMPEKTLVWFQNGHLFLEDPMVMQGIANLREEFKGTSRTFVMLCPTLALRDELRNDVIVLDDPLPSDEDLSEIVTEIHKAAELEDPSEDDVRRAVNTVRGLSVFGAEQVLAMCIRKEGLDFTELWARKKAYIDQISGLSITYGGPTLEDVKGMEQIKKLLLRLDVDLVVFTDEIEKALAGTGIGGPGDSSGTTQDQLGVMLSEMEDNGYMGLIMVGPPGTGKSYMAKLVGSSNDAPTLTMDLGAMKGSLVGQSEQNSRQAFKTIKGVAGPKGRVLFVATSNRLSSIPPELKRRFTLGVWYSDLPTKEEREQIWEYHMEKVGLDAKAERPDDEGWTGAEIRNVCRLASDLDMPLTEARAFVNPFVESSPEALDEMRKAAHNKFLHTATEGRYQMKVETVSAKGDKKGKRKLSL